MSSTFFLSPPPLSNTHQFPYYSNPISDSYIPISLSLIHNSLKKPKSIPASKLPVATFTTSLTQSSVNSSSDSDIINNNRSVKSTNPDDSSSLESISRGGSVIRIPIAPWMKGPLLLEPNQVLDLSKQRNKKKIIKGESKRPNGSLTDKVSGGRGKKAMRKIFEGIGKLRETQNSEESQEGIELDCTLREAGRDRSFTFGEKLTEKDNRMAFQRTEKQNSDKDQKSPENTGLVFSLGELEGDGKSNICRKMPWERDDRIVFRRMKKKKVVSTAELSLDGMLLERLRNEAARMRKWVKVKKAGVTQAVVDQIHLVWKSNELAMLRFDMPLCRNMDRAQEIVEIKTGGLVVWIKKDVLVVYRGFSYQLGLNNYSKVHHGLAIGGKKYSSNIRHQASITSSQVKINACTVNERMGRMDGEETILVNGSLFEREANRLLDGLGPRFVDWWMQKPLPVDADLLPEVVPGFKVPFRLCPPCTRSQLTDDELTYLRKLARPLPIHFVLGRNRKLQGLAAALLKLWEKCHIAKIAVKWGIPNTDNEQMANELKNLTGGVLLLRNKFFIVIYRGKDFLPSQVANLVVERELELKRCQFHEEAARLKAVETFCVTDEPSLNTSIIGTLSEFQDIQSECGDLKVGNRGVEVQLEAEKERLEKELRKQEHKLFIIKKKIERSGKELGKLNSALRHAEQDEDQEIITQEERECFRKIGLKMDSILVLGRRGVFDGVIEGLHQHWKHREIVKVITMQRMFSQVMFTAKLLEAKSGGILVSVDKLKEGHAIIMYRGKNYRRPVKLVPQDLLNKREALNRSLEMQRIGSLKFFAHQRQLAISELKHKLNIKDRRNLRTNATTMVNRGISQKTVISQRISRSMMHKQT
ncbi:unnamed protein product [Ilex paraguariensis]|uniref:CRM domain-containing protein n=1 Tax=Ilex paraguariensis TaxID=185542 RepID=A0ABC8R1S5_9AQUA